MRNLMWNQAMRNIRNHHNTWRGIVIFLAITVIFSAVFWNLMISAGSLDSAGGLYTLGLMWCPGVAALATVALERRPLTCLGWRPGRPRYLLTAYLLPLFYAGLPYAALWLTGVTGFTLDALPQALSLPIFLAFNLTAGFLGSLISALGEEIGWRGFLVPELARMMRPRWAALISGTIWALWHYPILLLAGYHGTAPIAFGLVCFTVMVVALSLPFAWLRLASGSLWTAALLHASHNLIIQQVLDPLTASTGWALYLTGEFGLTLALAALIVGWLFWRLPEAGLASR